MLRRVMVCLDDRPGGHAALDSALRFAASYGATLTGLVVRDPQKDTATQDAREDLLLHGFREGCLGRGLTSAWLVRDGLPGDLIPQAARAFDLVVIGRDEGPREPGGSIASTLVRRVGCPVMLVSSEPAALATIALAYDGSQGADRALALTADVATHWKGGEVAVALIGVDAGDGHVRQALIEAEQYLDTYHLAHRTHALEGAAADLIAQVALREKAELLVMGAYGHSRAREVLVGSTTHQLVDRWKGALLLWR